MSVVRLHAGRRHAVPAFRHGGSCLARGGSHSGCVGGFAAAPLPQLRRRHLGTARSRGTALERSPPLEPLRMILAGDIGGTNTRLALFDGTPDRLNPLDIEVFPSPQFSGLPEIVRKYLAKHNKTVQAAAFGLPGAVVDGRVETTNLPWVVDSRHLAQELSLDRVDLINDLFANAHGIVLLQESDFVALNQGTPSPTGNRVLISAGTGLGEAGLLAEAGGGFRAFRFRAHQRNPNGSTALPFRTLRACQLRACAFWSWTA